MRLQYSMLKRGTCAIVTASWLALGFGLSWATPDDVQNIPAPLIPEENPTDPLAPLPSQQQPAQPTQIPVQPSFQQAPSQTVIVPSPSAPATVPGVIPETTLPGVIPETTVPGGTAIVVPDTPQPPVVQQPQSNPVIPPETLAVPQTAPKVETPQVRPPLVTTPEKTPVPVVIPEKQVQPEAVVVPTPEMQTKPDSPKTQADFLIKTPEPTKKEPQKPAEEAEKKNLTPEPKKTEAPKKEPKPEPKPEPKKELPEPPRKGDPLHVPPEAKKTGDVGFLKGCWKGKRPEYYSKRMIVERFCFDEKGIGKRTITDIQNGNQCVGSARAAMNGGALRVQSGNGHCSNGETWGVADMICEGEGNQTPCSWRFEDAGTNARQSYKIQFVRD